eukprot:c19332_g1_i1 orf=905-1294(+)
MAGLCTVPRPCLVVMFYPDGRRVGCRETGCPPWRNLPTTAWKQAGNSEGEGVGVVLCQICSYLLSIPLCNNTHHTFFFKDTPYTSTNPGPKNSPCTPPQPSPLPYAPQTHGLSPQKDPWELSQRERPTS